MGEKCETINKREEFDELLSPIESDLRSFVHHYARDDFESDYVFQLTLMRAYNKFYQFETGTNFKGWIFRIAFTTFLTIFRKTKRMPKFIYDTVNNPELQIEDSSPYDYYQEEEQEKLVDTDTFNHALMKLSETQKKVLHYYYNEEIKYKDIATKLNIPIGTVMSNLNRAREKMRKYIENQRMHE